MKAEPVALNLICVTPESQSRAVTDRRTVEEYVEAWKSGADFPPVDLFTEDTRYFAGDGVHRILSAKLAGRAAILAYVYRGDERDAFLHSCSSNHAHGLRRSNADKRHMVSRMLNDREWVKWSDRRIAEQCGVSPQFVTNIRHELSTVDGSPARWHGNDPRLGADGKLRRPPDSNGARQIRPSNSTLRLANHRLAASAQAETPAIILQARDLHSRRQEALALLDRLRHVLRALDMYECCADEVESLDERISKLDFAGLTA